jgi:hypothetical protein
MAIKISDTIPVIKSQFGAVWDFEFPEDLVPRSLAWLHSWALSAPWAHPIWKYYYVTLIHLRPVKGLPNAVKHDVQATHEIMVYALDPAHPVMQGVIPLALTPPNFCGQFEAESDAAAVEYVKLCLYEVCDGALSPDTDFRRDWVQRFPFIAEKLLVGSVH